MERTEDGQQIIGVVFDLVQVVMIFVIAVGGLVAVQVAPQVGLQRRIGGLGPQQVAVLGGIGAGGHRAHRGVTQGYHLRHTGLHDEQEQKAGHQDQRPHGMPPDEARHGPARGGGGFSRRLCALLGGLPLLFLILLFQLVLIPLAGEGVFHSLRVLLGQLAGLVVGLGFEIAGLGVSGGPGRMGADALFHKPRPAPQGGLAHHFRAVSALGAHVILLHLKELTVDIAMHPPPGGPAHPFDGAGPLGRFLVCQLLPGRLQLAAPFLHAELGLVQPLLCAFLPELLASLTRSVLAGAGAGSGLIRRFVHRPCPPAWWSAGHTARYPWGSDPQRGWRYRHRTAGPRRSRSA